MSTIINTPGNTNTTDEGAGWAVAIVILLVVIGVGAFLWINYGTTPATNTGPEGQTNINVTIPAPVENTTPAP